MEWNALLALPLLTVAFFPLLIMILFSISEKFKLLATNRKNGEKIAETFKDTNHIRNVFTFGFLRWFFRSLIPHIYRSASGVVLKRGHKAPDALVYSLSENKVINLLDMSKQGRPLILNFGSYT